MCQLFIKQAENISGWEEIECLVLILIQSNGAWKHIYRGKNCPWFLFAPQNKKAADGVCWLRPWLVVASAEVLLPPLDWELSLLSPSRMSQSIATGPRGRESWARAGQLVESQPVTVPANSRVTVPANWVESCFPMTLTGISLGCLSAWHKSNLLTHVHMPDLLQNPKLILIKPPQNKCSASMAAMLHSDLHYSPVTVRMPNSARRMGKLGLK